MSRRLSRISLALVLLLSSEAWALGLGEIRLQSALNEPLHAEIELLSATPDELGNLKIALASAETFDRYGIDRPVFLQGIQFRVVRSGTADGNVIELRSPGPITEPFLTFLVEANWARGRLLREYTVLLDPPTFAPQTARPAPAVTAPTRTAPADSGRIERSAPPPRRVESTPPPRQAAPQPEPRRTPEPQRGPEPQRTPEPVVDDTPYDTVAGGDLYVNRGDTLWGITARVRPDSRLTMNQTMLAIFGANPQAFAGNINRLEAGASLRIPSADEIFQIGRGAALDEVQRQNAEWGSGAPAVASDDTRPGLRLLPPDEDYAADSTGADTETLYGEDSEPLTREGEVEQRISELLAESPTEPSLIEIRDNELAALERELAEIRGEPYEPVEEVVAGMGEPAGDDNPFVDDDILVEEPLDESLIEEGTPAVDAGDADTDTLQPEPAVAPREAEPTLVDQVLDILKSFWTWIAGALVVVVGLLIWFMRRGGDDEYEPEAWRALDADDAEAGDMSATESMRAPSPEDESIMVVEQESAFGGTDETVDALAPDFDVEPATEETIEEPDDKAPTGEFGSLEDTFSSETAVNLDQSDPIAEADFHMAYGLYDQAADLINGALDIEPERSDLLTKLCEIYFVWGNRDAFVDAAGRLKSAVGNADSADWDKIVIMGQQIAADDELFAGAEVAGATRAVDLSFEAGMDETGALDMELVADSDADDVLDVGAETALTDAVDDASAVDFDLAGDDDLDGTAEAPTANVEDFDVTREMPAADEGTVEMPAADSTVETPTIEQQFDELGGTTELPSIDETVDEAIESTGQAAEETAEINLDDLGLDLDDLEETAVASLDDLDDTGETEALSATGVNEALQDAGDATGQNPLVDPDATGVQMALGGEDTGINEAIDADATGITEAPDFGGDTSTSATDVEIDAGLLEATGVTQVLPEDLAVETISDLEPALGDDDATMLAPGYGDGNADEPLGDDQETMLASLDDEDDDSDYDFAKTEALPADVFTDDTNLDETGELPAVASTDFDLDLDDLTAALKVSDAGNTIEQVRDDATIEQPRPAVPGPDEDDEVTSTVSLAPDDMSEDLHEARTMTEVGTKLDLARAYVDMGDPAGARSILEEVLDEGDEAQRQQAQQLLDSLPS